MKTITEIKRRIEFFENEILQSKDIIYIATLRFMIEELNWVLKN